MPIMILEEMDSLPIDIVNHIVSYASSLPRYMRTSKTWYEASKYLLNHTISHLNKHMPYWNSHIPMFLYEYAQETDLKGDIDIFILCIYLSRRDPKHHHILIEAMKVAHIFSRQDIVHRLIKVYKPPLSHEPIMVYNLYRYKHKDRHKYMEQMYNAYNTRLHQLIPYITPEIIHDMNKYKSISTIYIPGPEYIIEGPVLTYRDILSIDVYRRYSSCKTIESLVRMMLGKSTISRENIEFCRDMLYKIYSDIEYPNKDMKSVMNRLSPDNNVSRLLEHILPMFANGFGIQNEPHMMG